MTSLILPYELMRRVSQRIQSADNLILKPFSPPPSNATTTICSPHPSPRQPPPHALLPVPGQYSPLYVQSMPLSLLPPDAFEPSVYVQT
jgi:hypothetical protein